MDLQGEGLAGGEISDASDNSINGNGGHLHQRRGSLAINMLYMPYLSFMAILVPGIPLMSPSAFRTYPIRIATFLVSLCVSIVGMLLRPILPLTQFTAKLFSAALLFLSVISPCALLSVFVPDWLSLLGIALIFIITIVIVAPDFVWSVYEWLYQKAEFVIVRMIEKLRAWTISTGEITGQQEDSPV